MIVLCYGGGIQSSELEKVPAWTEGPGKFGCDSFVRLRDLAGVAIAGGPPSAGPRTLPQGPTDDMDRCSLVL